jgi:hypothetical protein
MVCWVFVVVVVRSLALAAAQRVVEAHGVAAAATADVAAVSTGGPYRWTHRALLETVLKAPGCVWLQVARCVRQPPGGSAEARATAVSTRASFGTPIEPH